MAASQSLDYNVRVNDAALDRLILKVTELNAALFSSAQAAKPLDVQLRAMGRRSVEIGRFLTRNLTVPIGLAAAAAGRLGFQFDSSLTKVAALTDTTHAQVSQFRKEILDFAGSNLTQGPQALGDALYFVRSSGIAASESMDVVKASSEAASAGLGDLATVADAVTSAMNAYAGSGLKAKDATDVLIKTVQEGKAEPQELASSIGRVLPIAAQMKVSFGEVGGAIAAMTLQGLSADLAVTGLRATLTTFLKALKPTRDGLAALGLTAKQVRNVIETEGLYPALKLISKQLQVFKANGGDVNAILAKLFPNVRALNAFLQLTGVNGAEAARVISRVEHSTGQTDKSFKAAQSSANEFRKVVNELKTEFTKLGESIYPLATTLLKGVRFLFTAFDKLPAPLKRMSGELVLILGVIGPLIYGFGQLVRLSSVWALKMIKDARAVATGARDAAAAYAGIGPAAEKSAAQVVAASRTMEKATVTETGIALFGGGTAVRGAKGQFVKRPPAAETKGGFGLKELFAGGLLANMGKLGGMLREARLGTMLLRGAMFGLTKVALPLFLLDLVLNWKQYYGWVKKAWEATMEFSGLFGKIKKEAQTAPGFSDRKTFVNTLRGDIDTLVSQGKTYGEAARIAATKYLGGWNSELRQKYGTIVGNAIKGAKSDQAAHDKGVKDAEAYGQGAKLGLKGLRNMLADTFSTVSDLVMDAFDAQTTRMEENLRVHVVAVVNGMREAFTMKPGDKTPAERELDALQKLHERQDLVQAVKDARKAYEQGAGALHTETQVGNVIYRVDRDKSDVAGLKKNLKDAEYNLRVFNLQTRADIERKAADKAIKLRQQQFEEQRKIERTYLQLRLKDLEKNIRNGNVAYDEGMKKLVGIMAKWNVPLKESGKLLGKAWADEMTKQLGKVDRLTNRILQRLGRASNKAVALGRTTTYGPGALAGPQRAGGGADLGAPVYVRNNVRVQSNAQAKSFANTLTKKLGGRR